MNITRIGSDFSIDRPTKRIEISIINEQGNTTHYVLTDKHGILKIHSRFDEINISPRRSNEIELT